VFDPANDADNFACDEFRFAFQKSSDAFPDRIFVAEKSLREGR